MNGGLYRYNYRLSILTKEITLRKRKKTDTPQYEIAIPTREELLALLQESGTPLNSKEISAAFNMPTDDERTAIKKRLAAMVRDGQIIRNRRGGYGLVNKMDLIPGRVIGHADGFGFLVPDAGGEDIFLPAKAMQSLLNGDRAVVRITGENRKGKPEGSLVEVLERANETIVGRYYKEKNIGYVIPDNKRLHQDILIPAGDEKKAKSGQFVVVRLTRQPDKHTQPVGKINEIIGDQISPGIATDVAIRTHEIPYTWPKELKHELSSLDAESIVIPAGKEDLRKIPFVTIDGEDARDFDDAVYCKRNDDGWLLYVAIADVSHYVRPDTVLDEEAYSRGTSVYFPDRVVPMLPEVLSNELCSLKPDVDRLSIVCEMTINKSGKIDDYRFIDAVIRSAARLTYTKAAAIMADRDQALRKRYAEIAGDLDQLYSLYQLMHKARKKHGVLDFDTRESRIRFDEKGNISSIEPMFRNDAHRLIEEFMLAANITAAEYILKHKRNCLFRVHLLPKQEKLKNVREFIKAFGVNLGGGENPTAMDYSRVIDDIKDRPDRHMIQTVLLRSMPLAYYGEENMGHFGLAFEAYTHFTSPIRRYPDLLVHRAIKSLVAKGHPYPYSEEEMRVFGVHCSSTERRAEEASRDVVQRLKCEYMKDRIGEIYDGTVTGVTGFGLFVELDQVYVEGLVHVTALPRDYYHHDPVHHRLAGERSGRSYRLADKITVKLVRVDTDENKIDFELVN
jgi:ribonuclease R